VSLNGDSQAFMYNTETLTPICFPHHSSNSKFHKGSLIQHNIRRDSEDGICATLHDFTVINC